MARPLLTLNHVTRTFLVKRQTIKAIDDLNLTIKEGEVLCLVGESGCGKTTTGKMIAGLLPASSGQVLYYGQDIARLDRQQRATIARRRVYDFGGTLLLISSALWVAWLIRYRPKQGSGAGAPAWRRQSPRSWWRGGRGSGGGRPAP